MSFGAFPRSAYVALVLGCMFAPRVAAAAAFSPALELVREAHDHEQQRNDDLAVRRYMEALALDSTCGAAYVGLGDLRAHMGDPREAERVYSVGLSHVPVLAGALIGRARVRKTLGRIDEARMDLHAYAEVAGDGDPKALREVAAWYGDEGLAPAQLAIWRRMRALAADAGDESLRREAATMVRALQFVVASADPVTTPPPRSPLRTLIARLARLTH
jgi:hypothetical protein